MKLLPPLASLALLSACATTPIPESEPQPAGSAVALGQPVSVDNLVLTPLSVVEDSRCPENARCVTPGNLVVSTRIDGPGWRDTALMILGRQHLFRGSIVALTSGTPERQADQETPASAYRFTFEKIRQLPVGQLGRRVQTDGPAVTPEAVLEDSRCPRDVQCVRAGELKLRTTVHLGSGDQTVELVVGRPVQVADGTLELAEVWPRPTAGEPIRPADYRFAFRFDGGL